MHHTHRSIAVVGAVVIRDGRVLLLQRTPHDTFPKLWELPGGKREDGEELLDALARELGEEARLRLISAEFLSTFEYDTTEVGTPIHSVQYNYLVVADGDAVHSEEHCALAWVPPTELDMYPMSKETRDVITQAFAQPSLR